MGKIVFMFPGQGAQYVGMGKDFYDSFACSKETFDKAKDDDLFSAVMSWD